MILASIAYLGLLGFGVYATTGGFIAGKFLWDNGGKLEAVLAGVWMLIGWVAIAWALVDAPFLKILS